MSIPVTASFIRQISANKYIPINYNEAEFIAAIISKDPKLY